MINILQSLSKTIHLSIVLAVLLFFGLFFGGGNWDFDTLFWSWLFRYLHVLAGIMWIGLLWYLNFVQIPSMPKLSDEQKPAITKVIAPAVLFWFRWAALATIITGLIMAFNVWFIIWPNQKKVLGIVDCSPEDKPKAMKTALITSRINTLFSLPMLLSMVVAQNLY